MTDKPTQQSPAPGDMKKDPDNRVIGEPTTGAQSSSLKASADPVLQPKSTERDDG